MVLPVLRFDSSVASLIRCASTPDSSRFWPLEGYKPGQGQPSFDKQFVRDWLKANPDSDYLLPDDVIEKTVNKYKEAYELLTGKKFA